VWACSSAGRAPALQISTVNHRSAASGVTYVEPRDAATLSNWAEVGAKVVLTFLDYAVVRAWSECPTETQICYSFVNYRND